MSNFVQKVVGMIEATDAVLKNNEKLASEVEGLKKESQELETKLAAAEKVKAEAKVEANQPVPTLGTPEKSASVAQPDSRESDKIWVETFGRA